MFRTLVIEAFALNAKVAKAFPEGGETIPLLLCVLRGNHCVLCVNRSLPGL